jgi:hypothetical protein
MNFIFHELKMKEFLVEAREVWGEGMMRHWRNDEGIYRAPSRVAQRREEQRDMLNC